MLKQAGIGGIILLYTTRIHIQIYIYIYIYIYKRKHNQTWSNLIYELQWTNEPTFYKNIYLCFSSVWEMSGWQGQTAILTQPFLLTIAAFLRILSGVAQPVVAEGHNPQSASCPSLWPSYPQLTQLPSALAYILS